jgi:hypothetical protein
METDHCFFMTLPPWAAYSLKDIPKKDAPVYKVFHIKHTFY